MKRVLVIALLLLSGASATCAGAVAGSPARHPHARLQAYVRKVAVEFRGYRKILSRAGTLLTTDNPDPATVTDGLRDVSGDLDRLSAGWSRIRAPANLRFHHRRVSGAFSLESAVFSTLAEAWEQAVATRDPTPIAEATERTAPLAARALHLEKQWAATLRGELRRAHLSVPKWLKQLATADEGPTH